MTKPGEVIINDEIKSREDVVAYINRLRSDILKAHDKGMSVFAVISLGVPFPESVTYSMEKMIAHALDLIKEHTGHDASFEDRLELMKMIQDELGISDDLKMMHQRPLTNKTQ